MTGTAAWGGTLAVDLLNGFTLASGDVFDIATFAADPGDFSAFSLGGIACTSATTDDWTCGSLIIEELFTSTSLDLDVTTNSGGGPISTPEPASLSLLGSALAALGWLRRRRRMASGRTPPPALVTGNDARQLE
jgi:hypothetical protein